jgi:hypothetical protein
MSPMARLRLASLLSYAEGMAVEPLDLVEEYRAYLERYEAVAGPSAFGSFVKHNGRLIKKLRYDEFEPRMSEYRDVEREYFSILDRGDTINDVVVRLLRERADELFLERPA